MAAAGLVAAIVGHRTPIIRATAAVGHVRRMIPPIHTSAWTLVRHQAQWKGRLLDRPYGDLVEYVEVARTESERGELVLRERRPRDGGPTVLELRANGVFVMDTAEHASERALADAALGLVDAAAPGAGRRARARLHPRPGARRPPGRAGATWSRSSRRWSGGCATAPSPTAARCWPTSRARVVVADVASAVAEAAPASYDVVLLDVDNGPGHLVHEANAALYRRAVPRGRARATGAGRRGRRLVGRSRARAGRQTCGPSSARPRSAATTSGSRTATSGTGSTSGAATGPGSVGGMSSTSRRPAPSTTRWATSRCPADALWRAQTQRAVDNFPISGRPLAARARPRPRPDQGGRRPGQRRPRRRHRRAARRDRRRRRRDRRAASTTTSSRSTSSRPAPAPAPT